MTKKFLINAFSLMGDEDIKSIKVSYFNLDIQAQNERSNRLK